MIHRWAMALATLLACSQPAFAGETVEVVQHDRSFSPSELAIHPGDTVRFVNQDDFSHNAISDTPGFEFDLKLQHPGEPKEITFDKPGIVMVGCDIHPKMHLVITIK
jgi:plastocyanin